MQSEIIASDDLLADLAEARPASRQSLKNMGASKFDDLALKYGHSILFILFDG
jgi:hypothetical protein